jgi:hypothetical protein
MNTIRNETFIEHQQIKIKLITLNYITKDATDRPHIDSDGIMSGTKQHLRSPIPKSDNLMGITLKRHSKGTTQSQISNLKNPSLLIKKKVLRLEIAVKHTVAVTVSNSLAELEEEALDEGRGERSRVGTFAVRIDEFLEIRIEKLENQVEIGFGVVVGVVGVKVFD